MKPVCKNYATQTIDPIPPEAGWTPDAVCFTCEFSLVCFTDCWGAGAFTTQEHLRRYHVGITETPVVALYTSANYIQAFPVSRKCQKFLHSTRKGGE